MRRMGWALLNCAIKRGCDSTELSLGPSVYCINGTAWSSKMNFFMTLFLITCTVNKGERTLPNFNMQLAKSKVDF